MSKFIDKRSLEQKFMKLNSKAIIVGPAYPYRGGQALVEAYLYNTLSTNGFDVQTISYSLLYPSIFFPGTTQFDESKFIPFEHQSKIKRLINSINPFTWFKAAKHICQANPDIIIIVWWMPFFGPALATIVKLVKKNCNAKIVFLVENYVSHEKRWFDSFATKHTLKYADAFICQSQYIYDQISKNFTNKAIKQTTLSIYDCYDLNRYDKSTAKQFLNINTDQVILFFGLIRPYKGLDKLLYAFKKLLQYKPSTSLLIVGECYEDINKYHSIIDNLQLKDHIQMHNAFIPNENIEPYFKAADLCCLPYNSGTQSGILMMAYGFKIPVVATNTGGITELIDQHSTGIIVENNSEEILVEGLLRILNDSSTNYAANINQRNKSLGYKGLTDFLKSQIATQ